MLKALLAAVAIVLCGAAAFTAIVAHRINKSHPPRGAFAAIAGGRLHYAERRAIGPERGVVVLIHGASGSQADLMIPLGDRLASAGFRVIAFDRPGLGWSSRPDGVQDASPRRQAELLVEAARSLGLSRAIVVAHSLAGAVGADLAIEHPDFVRGLVLLSPVTHPWPGGVAWYYREAASPYFGWLFVRLFSLPAGLIAMPSALESVFSPGPVPPKYVKRTGADLILTPERFRDNAEDVLALQDFVHWLAPRLPEISAPTAIVTGDIDGVVSPAIHSFTAAREIKGAKLTVLTGVGHSPHWARPDAVIAAIEDVARRSAAAEPSEVGVAPARRL